jgi:probable rRNA maturation factor
MIDMKQIIQAIVMKIKVNIQRVTKISGIPTDKEIRKWAKSALNNYNQDSEITVRIVDTDESRQLNRKWRNINEPTNVLSFPVEGIQIYAPGLLGDIVICAPIIINEARNQNKTVNAHWAHMVIHGILHLLGYDHNNFKNAEIMESLEIKLLESLGYNNPYLQL